MKEGDPKIDPDGAGRLLLNKFTVKLRHWKSLKNYFLIKIKKISFYTKIP